jgi:hypothetical protein
MDEEKIILDVLKDMELPQDVTTYDLRFSPDSTGIPSVYVNLHIANDNHPSKEKISRLSKARRAITDKLLAKGLENYPYVKLVTD